jgi:hypothetical protein
VINDGWWLFTIGAIITIYNSKLMSQNLFPTTVISNYGLRMVGYTDINDSSCILIKHKEKQTVFGNIFEELVGYFMWV